MGEPTLAELHAELAALDDLEAGLKARESDLLTELAAHIEKPPAALEKEHVSLVARLRALPLRRQQIADQAAALARAGHLKELEKLAAEHYAKQEGLHDFDRKLQKAQDALNALVKRRAELQAEIDAIARRRAKLARKLQEAGEWTPADDQQLTARYNYLAPEYPNYSAVMRRRAERGHLPAGMTLADFGLEPEDSAPEGAEG